MILVGCLAIGCEAELGSEPERRRIVGRDDAYRPRRTKAAFVPSHDRAYGLGGITGTRGPVCQHPRRFRKGIEIFAQTTMKIAQPDFADQPPTRTFLNREQTIAEHRPMAGITQQPAPIVFGALRPADEARRFRILRDGDPRREIVEPMRPQP